MKNQNPVPQKFLDEPLPLIAGDAEASAGLRPMDEAVYRTIFELMPGSVLLMDARGFVLDANPAFCAQIGYLREELVGGHVSRFSQDSIENIERNIARLMAGEILEHQVTNVQKNGTLRHYQLRETAITLPDGSRGILALAADITERLRAEDKKLEMERQLLHADKLKSLGVMAGGIAHDFNNLLATITASLELARMDLDQNSPVVEHLKEASTAAFRAGELTRQMLAYSGRGRFVVKAEQLSRLVQDMSGLLKAAVSRKTSLQLHLAPDLPLIEADGPQLQQVVLNLVTNAAEALGDKPGLITITTSVRDCDEEFLRKNRTGTHPPPGRYVVLEVQDTGCGMDEEAQAKLFDPFFTTKFTGRGLGMSAVLGVVRGHNGAILVSSRRGMGTHISVLFPAQAASATAVNFNVPASPTTFPAEPVNGTVLVVDDEASVRMLIKRILERLGLKVLTADDGEEGLAVFRQHAGEIAFVILDLTMPKLDGDRALAEMRKICPTVRAVLTSGYDVELFDRRFDQEGFAGFIRKPFQVETLINLAQRLGAEHQARKPQSQPLA